MGLHNGQQRNCRQQKDMGQKPLPPGLHLLPLLGNGLGKIDDDAQLRYLRGLEGQGRTGDAQPAGRAVLAQGQQPPVLIGAGNHDQHQQDNGHDHSQPGQTPEPFVVDLGHPEHGHHTQGGKHHLPLEVVQPVIFQPRVGLRRRKAGGQQHNQPHRRQAQGQQQKGHIQRTPRGLPCLLALAPVLPLLLPLELTVFVTGQRNAVPGLHRADLSLRHWLCLLCRDEK